MSQTLCPRYWHQISSNYVPPNPPPLPQFPSQKKLNCCQVSVLSIDFTVSSTFNSFLCIKFLATVRPFLFCHTFACLYLLGLCLLNFLCRHIHCVNSIISSNGARTLLFFTISGIAGTLNYAGCW